MHYTQWKKPDSNGNTGYDTIYMKSRKGKRLGTDFRAVLVRDCGWRERLTTKGHKETLQGVQIALYLDGGNGYKTTFTKI